jgi:hypothetical protein
VEKDVLSSLWKSHFVDRRVKGTLRELVDTTDRKLVLLIRRRTADLSPKDIVASLRRLDIRIEAPESPYEPRNPPKPTPSIRKGNGKRIEGGIALADLIRAGILSSPLRLFRKYKGQLVEASVLSDGAVEFQGQSYRTSSAAAEAARKSITGKRLNTNGWTFWQYQSADGKTLTLADARKRFAKSGSKFVEGRAEGALRRHGRTSSEDQPERRRLRLKFWQGLLGRPGVRGTRHADLSPGDSGWIAAGSGVRGLPFVYVIKQEEGRVELFIDRGAGKAAENKRIFDWLEQRKEEIERAFGAKLSWERLEGKQSCRISYTATGGGYRSDESKWPGILDAMIDAMVRLEKALTPRLAELKTELAS